MGEDSVMSSPVAYPMRWMVVLVNRGETPEKDKAFGQWFLALAAQWKH